MYIRCRLGRACEAQHEMANNGSIVGLRALSPTYGYSMLLGKGLVKHYGRKPRNFGKIGIFVATVL